MGVCISTTKVTGFNHHHITNKNNKDDPVSSKLESAVDKPPPHVTDRTDKDQQQQKNPPPLPQVKGKEKPTKKQGGSISCGKRTDFGYAKDFDNRYKLGKLLGHGQFGYTFVGTDKANGDRVAVKRIDKTKVGLLFL